MILVVHKGFLKIYLWIGFSSKIFPKFTRGKMQFVIFIDLIAPVLLVIAYNKYEKCDVYISAV